MWLELVPRQGAASWKRLLPKTGGIIGLANCIMNEAYIDSLLSPPPPLDNSSQLSQVKTEEEEQKKKRRKVAQQQLLKTDGREESSEDAYAAMMMKINMDIITSTSSSGSPRSEGRDRLLSRVFKGLVAEESVHVEPGAEQEMNLFIVDDSTEKKGDEEFSVRALLRLLVDVTANEDFRYFNNCYHIEPQVCTVRPGICRVVKGTRPCVRVKLRNPRSERVTLHRDAPVALIRLHMEAEGDAAAEDRTSVTELSRRLVTVPALPATNTKVSNAVVTNRTFDAAKRLERVQKRCQRSWEKMISEDVFRKSLRVEARYPYFTAKAIHQRPKIPFGIKDGYELTMRVGINQDAIPKKVSEFNTHRLAVLWIRICMDPRSIWALGGFGFTTLDPVNLTSWWSTSGPLAVFRILIGSVWYRSGSVFGVWIRFQITVLYGPYLYRLETF